MRLHRGLGRHRREGVSSMLDALFVVLMVTVAIVGMWAISFSGQGRSKVQQNDYDLHFTSLALPRILQSTIPSVLLLEPSGDTVELEDQKVIGLLSLELVLLQGDGWGSGSFEAMHIWLQDSLEALLQPFHNWSLIAFDSTGLDLEKDPYPLNPFLFLSSAYADAGSWGDVFEGGEVFTSSYTYVIPRDLGTGPSGERVSLTVDLACWEA